MEEPKWKTVPRPGSEEKDLPKEMGAERPAIAWRKIALVATPLFLGVLNLVHAYMDRETSYQAGKERYERLVGEGRQEQQALINQGNIAAEQRRKSTIAAAKNFGQEIIDGAKQQAANERVSGQAESAVSLLQGEKTRALVGPQHQIIEGLLQITRETLRANEGIDISVSVEPLRAQFRGRTSRQSASGLDSRIHEMGRLVEQARIAMEREDLSRMGKPKFQGCQ